MFKKILSILLFSFTSFILIYCQNEQLLQYYDKEAILINYGTFGGIKLYNQGQISSINFGISKSFSEKLEKFPESKVTFEGYRTKNTIGNVCLFGGLGGILGGEYYCMTAFDKTSFNSGLNTYMTGYGIMLGGLVMSIIGSFILPSSYSDLFNSINSYNRNIIKNFNN